MFEPSRRPIQSWVPILSGLAWLWCAASFGLVGFLFSVIPGAMLLGSGMGALLFPGDRRIRQYVALGGFLGVPLAVPALFVAGPATGLLLIAASAASFVTAGLLSVAQEPPVAGVPEPEPSLALAAQVAIDDTLLGWMGLTLPMPGFGDTDRLRREVHEARSLFADRGWLEKPESYHREPPPLESARLTRRSVRGIDYEHLSFESAYEPHPDEPGRDRWLGYGPNRMGHAWVLRHAEADRPWLVCVHGFQMGTPAIDFQAFRVAHLHHKLGMNVALPILPLHGPRKIGRMSGDGFLAADFLDTVHAEANAMWDIRRVFSWIRAQGATRVGVHGLSLGGYNTALVASLDTDLACAIPGIPAADFGRLTWRHGPDLQLRWAEHRGLVHDEAAEVLQVVSPLSLEPKVDHAHRYLFGAVSDALVPADQVRDLWEHWDRPRIVWYQGGHITFRFHEPVRDLLEDAFVESGLANARA